MRSIVGAAFEGNKRARLAVDLFCYRLARSLLGFGLFRTKRAALVWRRDLVGP